MIKTALILLPILTGAASAQFAFDPAVSIPVGNQPEGLVIADLDGDGDSDVAAASDLPDRVSILFNAGDGTFAAPVVVLTGGGTSPHALAAGDLDGDGDIDLAVTLKNVNQVRVLRNSGGVFSLAGTTGVGGDPRDLRAADLDADGDLDLVTANRGGNSFTVLLNGGGATFTATTTALGTEPRGVAVGRFDADADLDLAVSIPDFRRVDLFSNNGSGAFSAGPTLSTGAQARPEGLVAADLDGDGDTDLAAAGSGGGLNVAIVFVHDGAGGFVGPATYGVGGADPSTIVAADLDLDGDVDLATANTDSNTVSLLPNGGGAVFGGPTTLGVGGAPQTLAAGDLDGNGSFDLAVTNNDTGDVSVLLNELGSGFADLRSALAGSNGVPSLTPTGTLLAGSSLTLDFANLLPASPFVLVAGASQIGAPFGGGTLVPNPDWLITLFTDSTGATSLSATWPTGVPAGVQVFLQAWQEDAGGVAGWAASNAVVGTTP